MVLIVFSFLTLLNILPTPLLYSHSQTLEADFCPIHSRGFFCIRIKKAMCSSDYREGGYLGAVVSRNLHV